MNVKSVASKLHHGELIKLLKDKSGVTYQDIADGIGRSIRTVQMWEKEKELPIANQELIALYFKIDPNAFVDNRIRQNELEKVKATRVRSINPDLSAQLDELRQQLEHMKKVEEEILRILKSNHRIN